MASTVRAAFIGLTEPAETILTSLLNTRGLRVVGLADSDKDRLERFGQKAGLATYDDHRIMLVETRPTVVFVNVGRHKEAEMLALAVELGISAWKPYPLARSFDEAVGFVQSFDKAKLGLYVGNPLRFGGGFGQVSEWLQELGPVHLVQDEYMVPAMESGEITGWRASKAQAGGGVLLEGAYPGLEVISSQFGLPEQVYCLISTGLGMQTDRPYETEDLGLLSLSFAGGTVASSTALRTAATTGGQTTVWHGSKGKLSFSPGLVRLKRTGATLDEVHRFRFAPARRYILQAAELVKVLRAECAPSSVGRDHLPVMAVIEAAYLSARTGQPECPSQFYEMHDLTPPASPVISSQVGLE